LGGEKFISSAKTCSIRRAQNQQRIGKSFAETHGQNAIIAETGAGSMAGDATVARCSHEIVIYMRGGLHGRN